MNYNHILYQWYLYVCHMCSTCTTFLFKQYKPMKNLSCTHMLTLTIIIVPAHIKHKMKIPWMVHDVQTQNGHSPPMKTSPIFSQHINAKTNIMHKTHRRL